MNKKVLIIILAAVVVIAAVCVGLLVDWTGSKSGSSIGVTDAKTPTTADQATLKFKSVVKEAESWDANSNVIVVGDNIYVGNGLAILKLDMQGEQVGEATLTAGMSSFAPRIAYADGMLFAFVNDFTNGYIEAVDTATMQTVWVSEGIEGMNGFSPITVSGDNLYIAVSGYDFENFVPTAGSVISMTIADDDTGSADEVKPLSFAYSDGLAYYWNGIAITENNIAIVGSVEGDLQTIDASTGAMIDSYNVGSKIATSITYVGGKAYFGTSAEFGAQGGLMSVDIAKDGSIKQASMQFCDLGAQTTTTPVISGGRVYVGTGDFLGGAGFFVIDAETMTSVYSAQVPGVDNWSGDDIAISGVQGTPVVTTAYGDTYVYFSINALPGGITVLKDAKGQSAADIASLFTPDTADQNATSASIIAGDDGTLYYTNDSGFLFAIGSAD
ncbi:MAG: PQQ-binding-like beta-propeller repeat protein [Clostridia bacterium]|nr:PQQ-binding-like beta-propeller repeat protein [Clostridia bacterium]